MKLDISHFVYIADWFWRVLLRAW